MPRNFVPFVAFLCVFSIAIGFALYTEHAWEDYYITFRASKNLATGHGLVFTEGQKLHTFTSPLGTLIPAALSFVSGNNSDFFVLWAFRIISSLFLGSAAVLLIRTARGMSYGLPAGVFLVGMIALDCKTIDFSINGMETALMIFFLALTLRILLVPVRRQSIWLGIAWAGLMWTRPDSFVYIAAISFGFFLFPSAIRETRGNLLRLYFKAGILTMALYLPWVLWAWHYYGSPIPNTVVAKGLGRSFRFRDFVTAFFFYPVGTLIFPRVFDEIFLSPYALMGGWPYLLQLFSRTLTWLCAFCWCIPSINARTRALSIALLLSTFYLDQIVPVPYPWYLPSCTLLAVWILAGILQQVSESFKQNSTFRKTIYAGACSVLAIAFALTLCAAFQLRIQQREIEIGLRKEIGLWLNRSAVTSSETVFLECLGYIGYYSQLKMLDFPGLSSPEVVAARKKLGRDDASLLIRDLRPDWLVLRPSEAATIAMKDKELLSAMYSRVKTFDASSRIASYRWLPGRAYLVHDQTFSIYRRQ